MASVTASRPVRVRKDAVLVAAVDVALEAAQGTADRAEHVGAHEGAVTVSDRLVEHRFACELPGYRGWHWTVTLARIPRSRKATVCEVELLPSGDALLAPEWLPWSQRLRPEDIGPHDVLPFKPDDPRLEPGFTPTGDEQIDSVAIDELALARARVLSQDGIAEAAQRWFDGASGPRSESSLASAADCSTCGFLVPLQGSLGQVFGVCANPWSPDDGRVVAFAHGCGAHSETDIEPHPSDWPDKNPIIDEMQVEVVGSEEPSRAKRQQRVRTRGGKRVASEDVTPAAEVADTPLVVDVSSDPDPVSGADVATAEAPAAEAPAAEAPVSEPASSEPASSDVASSDDRPSVDSDVSDSAQE